jgi:predicted PurR-regulated permease PerM
VNGQQDRLVRWALRIWVTIGALLLVAAVWWLLREPIGLIVPPLAIAAVLIYVLNPAVSALAQRGFPRALATLLAYLATTAVVWGLLALVGPIVVGQGRELIAELPAIGAALQASVNEQLTRFGIPATQQLDLETSEIAVSVREWFTTNREEVLAVVRGAGSVVGWVVHLALAVTLGPILAFYALSDLDRLSSGMALLLPPGRRTEAVEVAGRIGRIVGSYFRGQLVVAVFVGTATALGLALVDLPFWAVVGIATGLFNLVPLIGPTLGGAIGVLVALTVGTGVQQAILVVVVMVAVQQVDNHLVTPLVVGRSVSIHPITVILALIVAGSLGGIPLMFIAIPVAATIKLVLLHLAVTRLPSMAHLADGHDDDSQPRRGTVAEMAQELRTAFESRLAAAQAQAGFRSRRAAEGEADDEDDVGPSAADDADRPTESVSGP